MPPPISGGTAPILGRNHQTDNQSRCKLPIRGDHDHYTTPSTSKQADAMEIITRKRPLDTPKLTLALNTLWRLKMKSLPVKNNVKRIIPPVPEKKKSVEGMAEGENKGTDQTEGKVVVLKKVDFGNSDESGDATELLETTASGYAAAAAAPQYVTDFAGMDYPLQQHIQNGNTAYVYTGDAPYQYYQYAANVHSPNTYMVAGGQSPGSGDDDHNNVQHATRACPATIQWLLENYEPSDGTSLPRCTLYDHYKKHCNEYKLDPVNAASFGKLIRNVFQNLRTRRLGTRGNSKYHYYGIRIKPESPLNRIESNSMNSPRGGVKRPAPQMAAHSRNSSSSPVASYSSTSTIASNTPAVPPAACGGSDLDKASLGDGEVPSVNFETFNGIDADLRKLGLGLEHVCKFIENYKYNCNDVLHYVRTLQFEAIEEVWTSFWQPDDLDEEDKALNSDRLSQQQIFSLCTLPQIQNYITNMDVAFYQVIVDILVPDVLMSKMTSTLTQLCRGFAKHADKYMRNALRGAPEQLQKKKLQAVKYMAQGLRRYTSLNHLAQAANTVLQKPEQVLQMQNDYERIDINQVQEQAGWVCECGSIVIFHIHNAFKDLLNKSASMSEWAEWMESILDQNAQSLSNYHGKEIEEIVATGKQFLLKWCFYTSILIRDLTLRSATSFGSFHLLRILTEEYMMYLVENRLGKAQGRPTITVLQQKTDYPLFGDVPTTGAPALPSISLNQPSLYVPSTSDPMMYGLQYQYQVIDHNEVEIDPVGVGHSEEGDLTEMQPRASLL